MTRTRLEIGNSVGVANRPLGLPKDTELALETIKRELLAAPESRRKRILEKFFLAALGSIPWVGGVLGALADLHDEEAEARRDGLQTRWLEEHSEKLDRLKQTLDELSVRFEMLGPEIDDRLQSEAYLTLVRRAFRTWDRADTEEKRSYIRNLVGNAAGTTRLCSDDVVRLFIDWLELYHEAHFAVIREIYRDPGITRFEIWSNLYGDPPREDAAEADLFRLLIRDLSTGGVARQERETNAEGQFLRRRRRRSGRPAATTESAFEDTNPYVLTSLGKQFVHYTMNDIVPRIGEREI